MDRTHRFITSLFLAAALAAPAAILADAKPQEAGVRVRVYDRGHKDYHNWDYREDHVYRGYLTDQHKEYGFYNRQSHREQRNYWNWRHNHPD